MQTAFPNRFFGELVVNRILVLAVLAVLFCSATCKANDATDAMTLDGLPILPRAVTVHEFSSHNKKGVNGDGGPEWILYKDEHGDSVLFDVVGPGCVRSFWQFDIHPHQALKFYFDGDKEPRYTILASDLYNGKHPLFPAPLASYKLTSHAPAWSCNCFVPIPFAKGLKITMTGVPAFYHFYYERYPDGTPVSSFTGNEDRSYVLGAFEKLGEELQPHADAEVVKTSVMHLDPDGRVDLLAMGKPGTVTRVVVEGDASDEFLHNVELEMYWDETIRPDVIAPLGIFFGSAVRAENLRSLPIKVEKLENGRVRLTCYWRMPFWRRGRIVLQNRQPKPTGPVAAEIQVVPNRYKEDETGYFMALYRDGRTEMGRDWLFADAVGTGWFVGVVQTMYGDQVPWNHYCEGNEHFVLDGAGMPQINGTGSEDYYLACCWPNYNYNFPFAGCVGDIVLQPGPASYYRFHIEAPIPFYQSLDARIQHGGNSDIVSQYRSVGFYYLRRRPAMRLTDFVDVGNEASERMHAYESTGSKPTGDLDVSYEGIASVTPIRDSGRTHTSGQITFTVAVDPKNSGVRLRRRLDQGGKRQGADVSVDGRLVGTWYHPDENPYLRWFDSDFELPAEVTRGKTALAIKLVIRKDKGFGPFTDFRYDVFSYEKR